jgi:hypothetical protein
MARNVIALMGTPVINEEPSAIEALIPGHLVELTSTGGVQKCTDDAANVAPSFVLERDELGTGIDTAYAIGDKVKVGTFKPGDRVYAFLASGQNVAIGAYLTSNATGLLTAASVAAGVRCARALEAVNTSGSAPVAGTRIRVEIV